MTRTYWVSFSAGEERPVGQRHLGSVVVDVTQDDVVDIVQTFPKVIHGEDEGWAAAALRRCWKANVNPGGSAAFMLVPKELLPQVAQFPRLTLMTKEDVEKLDGQGPQG